ncbi:MAG: amino acid permease [Phycisphaeraceae bacterium]|nr:amino acid permease [Phycisphaeraceae bacterium]
MLVTQRRPRNLDWLHAGPLLFGDWGTSRLYVLGLAFYYTAHASVAYLAAMSAVMIVVAWAYTVVCRCFPDGGGVYTAARQINGPLSVIGATLLVGGYIVTVAISVVEAFHYFGAAVGHGWGLFALCAMVIILLGAVNWFGARSAGRLALIIATASLLVSLVIAAACAPYLKEGVRTISLHSSQPAWDRWVSFVAIVLALSGVESVANMTGLMKEPVVRTSRRTIWPVLTEVVLLNLVFGVALTGLPALAATTTPDALTHGATPPPEVVAYRDTAMKVLAQATLGQTLGHIAAVVFGLLLLSAANTAIMAKVSVLYSLAHDRELPPRIGALNYSGVPAVALVIACVLPMVVLAVERDVARLAELYAIGVCGAVTINVLCCAINRALPIGRRERAALATTGAVMLAVSLTILATKWHAAVFAGGLVAVVLGVRAALRATQVPEEEALPVPARGWLAELEAPQPPIDASKPRIMLAARGRYQAEFAVDLATKRDATLFAMYVRTLRLMDVAPGTVPSVRDDPQAIEALGTIAVLARSRGVRFVPIYVCSDTIAEEILDYTVTFGCDTLILGKTRRRLLARRLSGDVVAEVAEHLPDSVQMILREGHPIAPGPSVPPGA